MKRKGFTLIELLIVIAVIAALAAMMTLSAGDSAAKARAASIISGFKMVRTAVVLYEVDSADEGPTLAFFNETASKDYVGPESLTLLRKYTVAFNNEANNSADWKATYDYGTNNTTVGTQIDNVGNILGISTSSGTATMRVK